MTVSPRAKKILLVVIIVAAAGGVIVTGIVVTRTILSKASELPAAPPVTVTKLAPPAAPPKTATAAPTPLPEKPKTPAPAQTPTTPAAPAKTSTGWIVTGSGNVDITPSLSPDLKNLYVDFGGTGINTVTGMDYALTYTAYPNLPRSIRGNFTSPYTRKVVPLGTCSNTTCIYDTTPTGFVLKVLVKTNNGVTVNLKTLTFSGETPAESE